MSNQRQRHGQQRRRSGNRPDIWREPAPLPEVEPIKPASEATALVWSLGEPPLNGGAEVAIQFATVIDRAAMLATALALSAGILADT